MTNQAPIDIPRRLLELLRAGQLESAFTLLKQVQGKKMPTASHWLSLAQICGQNGLFQQCIQCCQKALQAEPNNSIACSMLSNAWLVLGDRDKAIGLARQGITISPGDATLHYNFGVVLRACERYGEAINEFEQAVSLNPDNASAHFLLASCSQTVGHSENVIKHFEKAYELDPKQLMALVGLALLYIDAREFDMANKYIDLALEASPDLLPARTARASVLQFSGDSAGAYEILKDILAAGNPAPDALLVYGRICHEHGDPDEFIRLAKQRLADPGLQAAQKVFLSYLLGDNFDRAGDYESAFRYYRDANETMSVPCLVETYAEEAERLMAIYSKEYLADCPRLERGCETPVFIVGMPRSGTTLVEQILSMHSDVEAGGELEYLDRVKEKIPAMVASGKAFPYGVPELSRENLEELAGDYLELLRTHSDTAIRITNKMPKNYYSLGLIEQIFPDAKIVHCRRDPRDVCLSIYFQNFMIKQPYSTSLRNIALTYLVYDRLMKHWHSVLDIPILDVQYEKVVSNSKEKSREVVSFCGLEWEDACIEFYRSRRVVKTASHDQVNKPIYTKSAGRWRNYASHLDEVYEILGQVIQEFEDRMSGY